MRLAAHMVCTYSPAMRSFTTFHAHHAIVPVGTCIYMLGCAFRTHVHSGSPEVSSILSLGQWRDEGWARCSAHGKLSRLKYGKKKAMACEKAASLENSVGLSR